jgi:CRISPR-associated protein Cas2
MYDLPTTEEEDRRSASKFRAKLIDIGFEMSNFSVYCRWFATKEKAMPYIEKIKESVPENGGTVSILSITDKQFENIINISKPSKKERKEKTREISKRKHPVMQQPDLFSFL